MPDYKNPLAVKKDKPKTKTYNFTAEQLRQYEMQPCGMAEKACDACAI